MINLNLPLLKPSVVFTLRDKTDNSIVVVTLPLTDEMKPLYDANREHIIHGFMLQTKSKECAYIMAILKSVEETNQSIVSIQRGLMLISPVEVSSN